MFSLVIQMGSTVYICYKKSMAKTNFLAYKPGILSNISDILILSSKYKYLICNVWI